MNFNEKLMELRKQRGWSQEQLGQEINVSRQTVSKWELGLTTPELDKLIQLSDLFDITTDELIGREHPNLPPNQTSSSYHKEENFPKFNPGYFGRGFYYGYCYEYKSKRTLFGFPLVHINVVPGHRRAKGILAIGDIATGFLAIGGLSFGAVALGGLSIGLLAVGGGAAALLLAAGGIAIGSVAVGGLAIGLLAVGGGAIGMYSLGGGAIASRIAAGGYANAPIAIGASAYGTYTFDTNHLPPVEVIRTTIRDVFPNTWNVLVRLFCSVRS